MALAATLLPQVARAAETMPADPVDVPVTFRPDRVDAGRAVALHEDGTSVMAGDAGGDFGLARSSPYYPNSWGGDGQVTLDFDGRRDAALAVAAAEDSATVAAGTSSGDVAVAYLDDQGFPSAVFGQAGRVLTDLGGSDDAAYGVVAVAGGGALVAGGNAASAVMLRYHPDGTLDPSFGSGGRVSRAAPGPWRALAVQPDGKLVVAGGGGSAGLLVARYHADGTPDSGFGTGGQVTQLAGTGAVAHALSLWVDGSVSAAGGRNGDVAMARWDASGAPVTAFGGTGAVVVDLGAHETAYGLAVNYEGTMNVVGERGDWGFAASYLPDGSPNPEVSADGTILTEGHRFDYVQKLRAIVRRLDHGFAVAGTYDQDMSGTTFTIVNGRGWFYPGGLLDFASVQEEAFRAVRQPDGKVLVAGVTSGMAGVVRYSADGTLDRSYGVDGRAVSGLATHVKAVTVDAAGGTVVAGSYRGRLALVRFDRSGRPDLSFGRGGRAQPDGAEPTWDPQSLLALPDGKLLALGGMTPPSGSEFGGWVARFDAQGVPDRSFGSSGIRVGAYRNAPSAHAGRAIRQPDGKVLVIGPSRWITRLLPDGTRDPGYGADGTVELGSSGPVLLGAALLPDGRLVVGRDGHHNWPEQALVRLTSSGRVDPTFDSRPPYSDNPTAQTVIPLPDGRILGESAGRTFRLLPTGAADRSYGDRGVLETTDPDRRPRSVDAFLDPDGRLLTAGTTSYEGFTLVRSRTGIVARPSPAAWGWNPLGQLGTGATTDRAAPTTVAGLTDVVSVAAGTYHSLAVRSDGTVWAWGWNGVGQLGDGTTTDRHAPVRVQGLENVNAVSAGAGHSLAVKADGTVWAWGWNVVGQLGDGTTIDRHTPVRIAALHAGWRAVSAGALHSLALSEGGRVRAWGWNGVGQLGDGTTIDRHTPVEPQTSPPGYMYPIPIAAISAGGYHSMSVTIHGGVQAWGWNAFGQLGDGTAVDRHMPVWLAVGATVRDIAAGALHTVAALRDGGVKAWGWNGAGMVGDGTLTDRVSPVAVPGLSGVRSVAAGAYHSMAVGMEGAVRAWGWNGVGQLGAGGTADSRVPVAVPGPPSAVIAAGGFHSLAA